MKPSLVITAEGERAGILGQLRHLLPRLESSAPPRTLPFGIAALDSRLPQGGLAFGALHEIAPATTQDGPAAFGFAAALLGRLSPARPALLVTAPQGLAENSRPHGHGLHRLGLQPARVILVKTFNRKQTLWALEETLRANGPGAVAGLLDRLDLRESQRLQLAARESGVPLLVLRHGQAPESSVAVTRWRVGALPAARDRFGLLARWRWRLTLERCRNGQTGEWLVEFDHAYRFSLAAALADPALSRRAGEQSVPHAG
jgi:protein ImuA